MGAMGATGATGPMGEAADAGPGVTLMRFTGKQGPCTNGGVKFTSGTQTEYVCDPARYKLFTRAGQAVVLDEQTGFMWTQADQGFLEQGPAISFCAASTYGGYSGWRLPKQAELQTLLVLGQTPAFPAIDRDFFPNTSQFYILSESAGNDPAFPYAMSFTDGMLTVIGGGQTVRCVR